MPISCFANLSIAAWERQFIRDLNIACVNTTFKTTLMTASHRPCAVLNWLSAANVQAYRDVGPLGALKLSGVG
jgi:hypothetical protein